MYKAERNLIQALVRHLRSSRSPWGTVQIAKEFSYQRGRTDVIALAADGLHIVAFEAKLIRWREALHQAYRNTCFAHTSYVVLPRDTAAVAEKFGGEFRLRNIGLCCLDGNKIEIVHKPEEQAPLEPWLSDEAAAAAKRCHHGAQWIGTRGSENLRRTSDAVCEERR